MPKPKSSNSLGIDFFKGSVKNDCILVEPLTVSEDNGLVKPQGYEDKPEYAKVLMVGEGRLFDNGTRIEPSVKVGQTVFFQRFSAQKVRLNGKDYLIIREEDIYWCGE
jgi:chaperonin GroES